MVAWSMPADAVDHHAWPALPPCTVAKLLGAERFRQMDMECTPRERQQDGASHGLIPFDEPRVALDARARARYRFRPHNSTWPPWRQADARIAAARFGEDAPLSKPVCEAFFADPRHTFWHMWGWSRFQERTAERDCAPPAERLAAWSAALVSADAPGARALCDRNWNQGMGGCKHPSQRPFFTGPRRGSRRVRALFGFQRDIRMHCNRDVSVVRALEQCAVGASVACQRTAHAILTLIGDAPAFSVCRNLEWALCALRDALPGQVPGSGIAFATAPQELSARWLVEDAESGPGPRYNSSLVFVLEACIVSTVCTNGADIFKLRAGKTFRCEGIDQRALERLPPFVSS